MYPQVAQTFERHLKAQYAIFDREDTQHAFAMAHDKETFRNNLDAWCRRQAFDATVERIARDFKTTNIEKIRAVLRRAGVVYSATLHTAYLLGQQSSSVH